MIVTYNLDANQLWVQSSFIDDIISGETGYTTKVDITINGGNTVSITITSGTVNVPNSRFEIDPADLNLSDFINGVYSFKLSKINNSTSSSQYESYCLFIDKDFTCETVDNIASSITDQDKVIYTIGMFNLLKNIHQCEKCNCTSALTLWNQINYELGLEIKQNDCGCN